MKLSAPIFRLKRRARLLARQSRVPLHEALDQVARDEGFRAWSHLSASASRALSAPALLAQFDPGDLVLLAARPGHGKTMMGLALAVEGVRSGRRAFFFTLEDNEEVVLGRLRTMGTDGIAVEENLAVDTSDDICAGHIIERVGAVSVGAVVIIDYLQLLDQRRRNPPLADQIEALRTFAMTTGSIIVLLSQIDRTFEAAGRNLPGLADIRLPNPFDLGSVAKACFLHDGEARLQKVGVERRSPRSPEAAS